MSDICHKIVEDAISAQNAEMDIIRSKRGTQFMIDHARPYIEAVNNTGAAGGQSGSVIGLYVGSINAHFNALINTPTTVPPEDEPYLGRLQVPAVLEILYREDGDFRKSVEIFIDALERSRSLVGQNILKSLERPISLDDRPGLRSQSFPYAVLQQVLRPALIPDEHRSAILAAGSWMLNDSCGMGQAFFKEVDAGVSLEDALDAEVLRMKSIFDQPVRTQAEISESSRGPSFDAAGYGADYGRGAEGAVKEAMDDRVNYANIINISAFSVEGMSPLSQSSLSMVKDDLTMAVLEAVASVMEASLRGSVDRFKSADHPLVLAAGAVGCALEYILEMDGFPALDIVGLLRRAPPSHRSQQPFTGGASDFYHLDFIDLIYNGWRYLDNTSRKGKACSARGLPVPKVTWFDVDLSPIRDNEVLMNPQRYSNPAAPAAARLSALLRLSDRPWLFSAGAISAVMANILSLQKENPVYPADIYRSYVMGRLNSSNIDYCRPAEAA